MLHVGLFCIVGVGWCITFPLLLIARMAICMLLFCMEKLGQRFHSGDVVLVAAAAFALSTRSASKIVHSFTRFNVATRSVNYSFVRIIFSTIFTFLKS